MAEPLDFASVTAAKPGAQKTRKVLVKKAKEGVNINKYAWLAGHGLTLVFGAVYIIFYTLKWFLSSWYWTPRICYRLSFIGVLVAYTVSILTTFGGILPGFHTLLATENFQNLILAGIWLISRPSAFKLLPYYAIALLQLASMFNVKAVLKLQDVVSDVIATSELFVILALIVDTLLFRGTSGYALTIYLIFYWLRVNFSPYTQAYLLKIVQIVDDKVMVKQKPEIQAKWQKFKDFVEFRRRQTDQMLNDNLDHEPQVVDTSSGNKNAGKVLQKGKQMDVIGKQVTENSESGVPQGVNVPELKRQIDINTPSTTNGTSSAPQTVGSEKSTQSSQGNPTSGFIPGTVNGSTEPSTTANGPSENKNNAVPSQTAQPSSNGTTTTAKLPEPVNSAVVNTQDTTAKADAQVQSSATQVSGRISAPAGSSPTPSPSKQHSLDPRQQLINKAQQIKDGSSEGVAAATTNGNGESNGGVLQSAQTELQRVQQAAQAQISSSQH